MDEGTMIACCIGFGLAILTTCLGSRNPNRGRRQGPSIIIFLILLVLCFPIALIYVVWPRKRVIGGRGYLSRGELRKLDAIEAQELRAKIKALR